MEMKDGAELWSFLCNPGPLICVFLASSFYPRFRPDTFLIIFFEKSSSVLMLKRVCDYLPHLSIKQVQKGGTRIEPSLFDNPWDDIWILSCSASQKGYLSEGMLECSLFKFTYSQTPEIKLSSSHPQLPSEHLTATSQMKEHLPLWNTRIP